jgi:hypothetical protein
MPAAGLDPDRAGAERHPVPVAALLRETREPADGPILAATLAIRQRTVPADRYAQTADTAASLKTGAYALGAAVAGLLAGALTARQLVLLVGIGQLLAIAPFLGRRGRVAEISFID